MIKIWGVSVRFNAKNETLVDQARMIKQKKNDILALRYQK